MKISAHRFPFAVALLLIAALWGEEIVSVSAGMEFSLAITDEGRVFAWGSNSCGQLGDGTFDDHYLPQLVRAS
ncbi:MAG: hypothetical protein DRJ64_02615, partial [Thermoprotei archaeon]